MNYNKNLVYLVFQQLNGTNIWIRGGFITEWQEDTCINNQEGAPVIQGRNIPLLEDF